VVAGAVASLVVAAAGALVSVAVGVAGVVAAPPVTTAGAFVSTATVVTFVTTTVAAAGAGSAAGALAVLVVVLSWLVGHPLVSVVVWVMAACWNTSVPISPSTSSFSFIAFSIVVYRFNPAPARIEKSLSLFSANCLSWLIGKFE
jgi:hypothetical protein